MKNLLLSTVIAIAMTGCSSGGGSGTGVATDPGFAAVNNSFQSIDSIMANDPSVVASSSDVQERSAGNLSLIWNGTPFMPDPRCSGGPSDVHCGGPAVAMKNYISFVLDRNAKRDNGSSISVFGRIQTQMATACILATVLGSLPTAGDHSIVFDSGTAAIATACGNDDSASLIGQTITATVSIPADTTYYDRKFVVTTDSSMGIYIRSNTTEVNISAAEVGTNGSRTHVALNRSTGVLRAEYVSRGSGGSGGGEWHRIYFDPATNVADIIGATFDSGTQRLFFTMVGHPNVPTSQTAFGVAVTGFGLTTADSGATATAPSLNYYKGCIDEASGAIATGETISCAGGVVGVDPTGAVNTVFNNMVSATAGASSIFAGANGFGESKSVPFTTGAQVFTQAVLVGP